MKYLVLLLIVVGGIWWIRQQRYPKHPTSHTKTAPQVMMPCTHCGTHVPENDAVRGTQGVSTVKNPKAFMTATKEAKSTTEEANTTTRSASTATRPASERR
jgi:hypothetical protein